VTKSLRIKNLRAHLFRAPCKEPLVTSFGTVLSRPALLIRAEEEDGTVGWGEIWCTFPVAAPEYKATLIEQVMAPLIEDRDWESPEEINQTLARETHIQALQAAEPGTFAGLVAGIDIAVWDVAARKAKQPLWKFLGGYSDGSMPIYGSGLNPDHPERLAAARQADGYIGFKLKVGFGKQRDLSNLETLRKTIGDNAQLLTDANQAWDLDTAITMAKEIAPFNVMWLEEPMPVDRSPAEWKALAQMSPVPLAGGENMFDDGTFDDAISLGALSFIQPDITKWGGFTGCLRVATRINQGGRVYCPHYLGGAIGVLASAHLLAAVGGDGLLEVDINPNPLREEMLNAPLPISAGRLNLPETPGLGFTPDLDRLAEFAVT